MARKNLSMDSYKTKISPKSKLNFKKATNDVVFFQYPQIRIEKERNFLPPPI